MKNNFDENSTFYKLFRLRLEMIDTLREQIKDKKSKITDTQYLIGVMPAFFGETIVKIFEEMPTFVDCKFERQYYDNTERIKTNLDIDAEFKFSLDGVDFYMNTDTSNKPNASELLQINPFRDTQRCKDLVHIRYIAVGYKEGE